MWEKGQSGNPSGRPPKTERVRSFEQACRDHVVDLLPGMVEAVQDTEVPVRERTQLFELLCAYALGKPIDRLAVQSLNSNAEAAQILPKDVLERRVSALLSRADSDAEVVDVYTDVDTAVVSSQ